MERIPRKRKKALKRIFKKLNGCIAFKKKAIIIHINSEGGYI